MGTSTDAILAFGCDLGGPDEGLEAPWGESWNFDEWYLKLRGVSLDADYELRKKILSECPIEIIDHCSSGFTMQFAAVRGVPSFNASRGYPLRIDTHDLEASGQKAQLYSDAVERAQAFCAEHGLKFENPGWHLMSWWS